MDFNDPTWEKVLEKTHGIIDDMAERYINDIYDDIAHGDEEHRQWLKDRLEKWKPLLKDYL